MQNTSLREATMQDIQLEILRRSQFNEFVGERCHATLLAHRELWEAAIFDNSSLYKLRDLASNDWNVDTLYILTPSEDKAHQLVRIIEESNWDFDELTVSTGDSAGSELGEYPMEKAIITVWWD